MHTISFLANVRVMPARYDPELRSEAVRLVVEHRDDYLGEFEALAAVEFPDSDPQETEYFLRISGMTTPHSACLHDFGGCPK